MNGEQTQIERKPSRLPGLLMGAILVVAVFFLGFALGGGLSKNGGGLLGQNESGCTQEQLLAAMSDLGVLTPDMDPQMPVTEILGRIVEISDDYLLLSGQLTPADDVRRFRILVDEETEIYLLTELDDAALEKATREYETAMENFNPESSDEPPALPDPFGLQAATFKQLRIGDTVTVESMEDMRGLDEFTASTITTETSRSTPQISEPETNEAEDLNAEEEPVLEPVEETPEQ